MDKISWEKKIFCFVQWIKETMRELSNVTYIIVNERYWRECENIIIKKNNNKKKLSFYTVLFGRNKYRKN